jgi:hypothetical protein
MTGEVEVYEPQAAITAASFDLQQWARDAELVAGVAANLVKTSFVPRSYQGRALEATAAILTGQEIGLKPMAALRSIDVIEGTPGMRAVALRALVQAAGHEIWTEESNATQAIVKGQRKGSGKVETSVWTMDRAKQMNLSGKDNWRKQPIAMLLARATSECARLVAADVLLGIPYSTEELLDLGEVESSPEVPVPAKGRAVRRKPLPVKTDEPELDAVGAPDPVVEKALDAIELTPEEIEADARLAEERAIADEEPELE